MEVLRIFPELGAEARVDQRARVHRVTWTALPPGKCRALEEERTQLGIEDRKALVHLDLRTVRFDLREVRVVGEVEDQIRRDAILHVNRAF